MTTNEPWLNLDALGITEQDRTELEALTGRALNVATALQEVTTSARETLQALSAKLHDLPDGSAFDDAWRIVGAERLESVLEAVGRLARAGQMADADAADAIAELNRLRD